MKNSDTVAVQTGEAGANGAYRSGVAARLAGLPVETLRVWERRYALTEPQRSQRGQRLYSGQQVRRLGLIKQLVDQGHPIGALARLSFEQLTVLAEPIKAAGQREGALRVALVGDALSRQMAAGLPQAAGLQIVRSCARLAGAAEALHDCGAELLLIELSELDDSALPLIAAARDSAGVAAVVVLYRFCASATIRNLRAQGCLVARVPSDLAEVALLCHAALPGQRAAAAPDSGLAAVIGARRLDDEALARLAAASSNVMCECPRHLADILLMIGSFERYSAQCGARNPADAQLHLELAGAAAQARALLEAALERLARAEGLPLPEGLA